MNNPSMQARLANMALNGRKAARQKNWAVVKRFAREILSLDRSNADGWFLSGLVARSTGNYRQASVSLGKSLHYDSTRYDAAIELAGVYLAESRHLDAVSILLEYETQIQDSPFYLLMAAELFSRLAMHDRAWSLYDRANELQPKVDRIEAGLAASSVKVGKLELARNLYTGLLEKHPAHQRNHYELSRLGTAETPDHSNQMKALLESNRLPPEKNIFLYYALGKELEDQQQWEMAFNYYKSGGDAAAQQSRASGYDLDQDIELIDRIIEVCDSAWLSAATPSNAEKSPDKTPVFVVGLPRTGTTLTERIISSHSMVESADESFFIRQAIKHASGVRSTSDMTPQMIELAANRKSSNIAEKYLRDISYRLGNSPYFIDKYPENYLYLGFIARSFDKARIVHLRRNPMDACFAMFKQSYFRQAYTLDDLGNYYVAYDRLSRHWREVLGDRLIEVHYEELVSDLDSEVRSLLSKLGLRFEQECVDFHLNQSPSATASAAQIRETAHTRSINKWKNWQKQLQPLREHLEQSGIVIE